MPPAKKKQPKPKGSSKTNSRQPKPRYSSSQPDPVSSDGSFEESRGRPISASQPSSQTLLGRKNRLNDLLSSHIPAVPKSATRTKRPNRTNNSAVKTNNTTKKALAKNGKFEKDEDFRFKRSNSGEDENDHSWDKKKKRQTSTPLVRLREELNIMSREIDNDDDLDLLDLSGLKKSSKKEKSVQASKPVRKFNFNDTSLGLSSPIQSIDREGYSSDEYVEQVSHHKINLTEEPQKTKKKANRQQSKRRSSYYNRGKRVSSIGNGFVGEPHQDVDASDYYKLLDTSLPEPDRMRQLLIWCCKKKLDQEENLLKDKNPSTEDLTVLNIAKVIKEEILRDLMEKQISTSWYSNVPDEDEDTIGKEISVPNPLNESNKQNIDVYSKKLKALVKEKQVWHKSYENAISPIAKLDVGSVEEAKQEELQQYIKSKSESELQHVDYSTVIDNQLINKITANYDQLNSEVKDKVENSIDKVYHTVYQMEKSTELVETIHHRNLAPKVDSLLGDYTTKAKVENYRNLKQKEAQKSNWPVPSRIPGTLELLRSIARLETSRSHSR
ncbi:hypothetical protein G9P44_005290 [Scheffersomyces stipitis]|nr:hypothetical protein G9P44_005290 [Scheffersomyces stipitis]